MYDKILPEFMRILTRIDELENLGPKTIHINFDENGIIFEDLNVIGYEMPIRLDGLDLTHAKMVIRITAKMHAASAIYHDECPDKNELPGNFRKGMFCRESSILAPYFETTFKALGDAVSEWPGYEYYGEKLIKMRKTLVENGNQAFDVIEGDFNCLLHGDLWVNNTMFKYDESGHPTDVIMVDFQYCIYGSPMLDLLYFMCTSLADDLRANQQDELIQFYHQNLEEFLVRLKYKGNIPTLYDLQQQCLKKYFYGKTKYHDHS